MEQPIQWNDEVIAEARKTFAVRRLAIVPNVLTPQAASLLRQDAQDFSASAKKNHIMMQVHSGELLKRPEAAVHTLMNSPDLAKLVNAIVFGSGSARPSNAEQLGICPCANRESYSLYNADFGCKLNYYEGEERGIGWHFDKETSWQGPTYVVIYTIMLRKLEEDAVLPRSSAAALSPPPPVYEVLEQGRIHRFVIAENSLHIHDTRDVYHRALVPRGYKRRALLMHFSTAPCRPSPRAKGFSARLIWLNVWGRLHLAGATARDMRADDALLLLSCALLLVFSCGLALGELGRRRSAL